MPKTSAAPAIDIDLLGTAMLEDPELQPVIELLTDGKPEHEQARQDITRTLEDLGIRSVEDLQAKKAELIKDLRGKAGALFAYEVLPEVKEKKPSTRSGAINEANVGALLSGDRARHPVIRRLLALTPQNQVKALHKAGVRHKAQLDLGNERLMERLSDAIAEIPSGISTTRGRFPGEIATPTGSGKNR
ncbi:hypothetical protein HZA43_02555 [Candidatus Peregrinibacteria bacterium]|nr:hypothetical protein [Candidatus Peregrinibacteria bacterium]